MNKICMLFLLNFIIHLNAMTKNTSSNSNSDDATLWYSSELGSSVDFNFTPDQTPISSPREMAPQPPKETNRLKMCFKQLCCCFCCWCCAKKEYQSILEPEYPALIK